MRPQTQTQPQQQKYLDACFNGDTNTIACMIKTEDLNFRNIKFLIKCLKYACKGDHIEICKIIIYGHQTIQDLFSISVHNDDLREILYETCRIGNINIYKFYMNMTQYNYPSYDHFYIACCISGNETLARYIMDNQNMHADVMNVDIMYTVCKLGNIEIINTIIERGYNNWDEGLKGSCYGNSDDVEIVKLMTINGGTLSSDCIYLACVAGNIKIINFLIENYVHELDVENLEDLDDWDESGYWDRGLYGACRGGHMEIVELMIENGSSDWNGGMCGACRGGHMDMVEYMIDCGADEWSLGSYHASHCNQIEIVKLMLSQGAVNFDDCLKCACFCGDIVLATEMIEKGATDWNSGLLKACQEGHVELVQLMLQHGATNLNESLIMNNHNTKNTNISMLLVAQGANNLNCLSDTHDFRLLFAHNNFYKVKVKHNNYMDLLPKYPPCVLFVGSRLTKNNCMIKLPADLFKILCQY